MGASNLIPAFVPPLQDSRSFGIGQNAGRRVGRCWTAPATKVDRMPVGLADAMTAEAEARTPGRSAAQPPPSSSAVGLGATRPGRLAMQVGVVDGPGKGCAESLMRGRRREPLPSSAETENVRAVQGVYRSLSSVTERSES